MHQLLEIPQVECEALVALYDSTNGAGWTDNTDWNVTNTPCSWFVVTCSGGNVTEIDLSENQLNGFIPTEIGNLTNLTQLSLNSNQLSGGIPDLSPLTALTTLDFSANQLCKYPSVDYAPWDAKVNVYPDCNIIHPSNLVL
ncbi:hypothetical protein QUF74_19725 [Candidatus Halobeggiatoa sp. HSG11]|nr:hypothetical protein [Candidatus Halobeggiatoa sp. HSG11]